MRAEAISLGPPHHARRLNLPAKDAGPWQRLSKAGVQHPDDGLIPDGVTAIPIRRLGRRAFSEAAKLRKALLQGLQIQRKPLTHGIEAMRQFAGLTDHPLFLLDGRSGIKATSVSRIFFSLSKVSRFPP